MDWMQLWDVASAPDNIPIVLLAFLVPFFTWYGLRQAFANDRLIREFEKDASKAKGHHRKVEPFQKGWEETVYVWPHLLKIELLATIIVTVILMVWSVGLDAPLEEPSNPNLTMNPAKAPWYFLGLQEMLVYFDPWIAGVVLPTLIIVGLMAIPYCDINPLGNGYYTFRQRKFAILTFFFGFHVLWLLLIFIGVFVRGPGWMWFWPGTTWDHTRLIYETNRDLHQMPLIGITDPNIAMVFGGVVVLLYFVLGGGLLHWGAKKFMGETYARMNLFQIATMQFLMLMMMSLPVKTVLRLVFRIKYVWVTPWFSI
ncbi:MAG: cytochrome C [Planctomycetes bacterium]|nr:cytochrome C [Planctomycetota bacterium]